jgi:hypothetical protein
MIPFQLIVTLASEADVSIETARRWLIGMPAGRRTHRDLQAALARLQQRPSSLAMTGDIARRA